MAIFQFPKPDLKFHMTLKWPNLGRSVFWIFFIRAPEVQFLIPPKCSKLPVSGAVPCSSGSKLNEGEQGIPLSAGSDRGSWSNKLGDAITSHLKLSITH